MTSTAERRTPVGTRPTRHRRLRRSAMAAAILVLAVSVAAAGIAVWSVRRSFPQVRGAATLPVLDGEVEVLRDEVGVVNLYATTSRDLYRAQGYVHAQERFWQMDVWRHIGAGRTAELFGAAQLETDRFLRTLGWARVAGEELRLLDGQTLRMLADYADGVNAYLAERSPGALSLEYTILGLQRPGYVPEPWEPLDTLVFLKLMAWDLRANIEDEIERAILSQHLGEERADELFPPYPGDGPVVLDRGGRASRPSVTAALVEVADRIAAVEKLTGSHADGAGSNSWVMAGDRTATGRPMLANDPHLSIQMPSIWFQIGLHCPQRSEHCRDDVTGFSFPGVPGVVIGHNDRVAWGFTSLGADVMDLFVERINPEDPEEYQLDGRWIDMEIVEETIRVAGGEDETVRIRTTRHGPIISDTYGELESFHADRRGEYALALRWTALDPGTTIHALQAMNRAHDWESFRAAARFFSVPSQNLLYADVDGNIGYQAPGRIPVRASGDGRAPVPGWTRRHDWTGFIPFEELPTARNPDRGWIVTANNRVIDPDAYPYLLTTDWDHGYRARRIEQLIEGLDGPATLDDLQRIQGDTYDPSAAWLLPALAAVEAEGTGATIQELLDGWDGRTGASSAAAAAYEATWRHLLDRTFGDELPEGYHASGGSRWFEVVRRLLDHEHDPWWDDVGTDAVETRDVILARAMSAAHEELTQRLGDDPSDWRWGDLHTATFRNGTLGESGIGLIEDRLNRGPFAVGGGSSIVNATAWNAAEGYEVIAVPSMRMLVDLAALDRSRALHATGQSGHAYHPDYTSMITLWRENRQRPMTWTRDAVEAAARDVMILRP